VTRFEHTTDSNSPIEKLHDLSFNDGTPQSSCKKKRFLATLAVLLSRIVTLAHKRQDDLWRIMAVEGPELKGIANLFGATAEDTYNARLEQTFISHNGYSNRVPRHDKTIRRSVVSGKGGESCGVERGSNTAT
jgi:hypothetical protein